MSEEKKVSANAGSTNGSADGANAGKPEDASKNEGKQEILPGTPTYDELFKKLGEQGEELGSLRKLFEETSPLMEKLNNSPDLVRAIMDDKLSDENLIKAVLEGNVSVTEAKKVEKASEQVKEEIGKKEYEKLTPEQVSKMIEEKMSGVKKDAETILNEIKEERELEKYEDRINDFITSHKDFPEYAVEINKYLEEEGSVDLQKAYSVVKLKAKEEKENADAEANAKEEAKNMVSNMGGGGSMRGKVIQDKNLVDQLIAGGRR
jgi:predicted AAA+ superfamily ATPase